MVLILKRYRAYLLQKVESQLKQKIERKELFTINWKIV